MLNLPEGYIRKRSSTIPFGYEIDEETKGYLKPIPQQLEVLEEVSKAVYKQEISLGVGVDWLEAETNRSMSRMGLKNMLIKYIKNLILYLTKAEYPSIL